MALVHYDSVDIPGEPVVIHRPVALVAVLCAPRVLHEPLDRLVVLTVDSDEDHRMVRCRVPVGNHLLFG